MLTKPCQRDGCDQSGKPTYCSRKCAGIVNAAKWGQSYYQRIGTLSGRNRKKGTVALRPMELRLMATGRYHEAAFAIYQRAYGAGWCAGKRGHRQLPTKTVQVA